MVPQSTLMLSPPRASNGIPTAGVHNGDANGISAPDGFYFATAELAARAVVIHEEHATGAWRGRRRTRELGGGQICG